MKRIPKAFQLGPTRIVVKLVTPAEMREVCEKTGGPGGEDPPDGLTDFIGNVIYVRRVSKGFPAHTQRRVFWHEYFHMLFWHIGRERLSRDETLVDTCGAMQLQMIQSAEF